MKIKIVFIFCLFLFFLPLTQALTINLGFPFKISELILLILVFILFYKSLFQTKIQKPNELNLLLLLFLFWAILSFFINSFWDYNYSLKKIPFRVSALGDSFLRVCYIALNFLAFFITVYFIRKKPNILKYWVYGAIIAGLYAWYLFVSSGLGLPYLRLFGMEEEPQTYNGFVRCGTFKEGNYFGLYLLLSAVVSLFLKKTKSAFFLFITIIITFSTITIISAFVFLIYVFRRLILKKVVLYSLITLMPILLVLTIYLSNTVYFKTHIYSKLYAPSNVLTQENFSKVDRLLTARIGYHQGLNNPFVGVGPYNYGLHYDRYNDFKTHILNNDEYSIWFFSKKNIRQIANNVYVEIFAEYGVIGFLIFIVFLAKIFIISKKSKNDLITGGILAILISFNAFPSFIMLFVWVFLAIPLGLNLQNNSDD